MDARTVLVADPSQQITSGLAQTLQPRFRVVCCHDGADFPAMLQQELPDLVIMELSLPHTDGLELLRELGCRESRPLVLIHTSANTDYLIGALHSLPVDYLMRKPTPISKVVQRARQMLEAQAQIQLDWGASDLMLRLGIPEHLQGYRNMVVGIPLLAEDPDQFLGKTLYQEIAHRNRVTTESVEKSIRDAIHAGWTRGNRQLWLQYFPGATEAPQNKPFLIRMAGILSRYRRCG